MRYIDLSNFINLTFLFLINLSAVKRQKDRYRGRQSHKQKGEEIERLFSNTINLHFTDTIEGKLRISNRIRSMCSVVVVGDVSPVVRTCDIDRIRYCGFGVNDVPKTYHSVHFIGCVRYENRKPKKVWAEKVVFIWNKRCSQIKHFHYITTP